MTGKGGCTGHHFGDEIMKRQVMAALLVILLTPMGEIVEIGDCLHVGLCRIILALVRTPLLWLDCAQVTNV